jgi:lipid A 3-O-deacylase
MKQAPSNTATSRSQSIGVHRHAMIAMCCLGPLGAWPDAAVAQARFAPDQYFVQAGVAEDARTLVFGASWEWIWKRDFASGTASGYWEASFGRWSAEGAGGGHDSAWVTQLGVTPVLRWRPRSWNDRWFFEAGIGANVLLPKYSSRDKRFSTAFNFGDHLAIGYRFGDANRHEVALRLQHFSNAGIKHPNPGENFLQLRYAFKY